MRRIDVVLYACFLVLHGLDGYDASVNNLDILAPYKFHHGPKKRTNRDVATCQNFRYGNVTHSKFKAASADNLTSPFFETRQAVVTLGEYYFDKRDEMFHYAVINNPLKTVSVIEPNFDGSCQEGNDSRRTVQETASRKHCHLAVNAGFFNTKNGQCLGNVISDGMLRKDSGGIQNAHFGITKDGFLYFGYLSEIDLLIQEYVQLVGGVIWLVRDGQVYVDESKNIECPDTEETGTIEEFVSVRSARVSVGHDSDGRLIIVQVEGQTGSRGMNLHELAETMVSLGAVNAINLDGGGSATMVINGTLVNYPSDTCKDNDKFKCARNVTTILCVHEPLCEPPDCSQHGTCVLGSCQCSSNWAGDSCNTLRCPNSCSHHGVCQEDGCQCEGGWQGEDCGIPCPAPWYGQECSFRCACQNNGSCDVVTGDCTCLPGYTGDMCEHNCPLGSYGNNCASICMCEDSCTCDPQSGDCNYTVGSGELSDTAHCLASQMIKGDNLVPDQSQDLRMSLHVLIGISIVACFSVTLNIALVYMYWKRERRKEHRYRQPRCRASSHTFLFHSDSEVLDTDSSNEIVELRESSPSITGMQKSKLIDRNGLARS